MKKRQRKARKRAPNLTDATVKAIIEILDGWTGPLSWELYIDAIEKRTHLRYTRQTLHKTPRIYSAFTHKKESLRVQPGGRKRVVSAEMQAALDTIASLEARVKRLKSENDRLLDRFAVWAYNARIRNVDEKMLNDPLPSINRC